MLPPIFSGPTSKKSSNKAQQLITTKQNNNLITSTPGVPKHQSNLSEQSPMMIHNNVEAHTSNSTTAAAGQSALQHEFFGMSASVPQNSRKMMVEFSPKHSKHPQQLPPQPSTETSASAAPKVNFVKKNEVRLK